MPKKDDISPEDKGFTRKANSIFPTGLKGSGSGAKYETLMDNIQEGALKRTAADVGMGFMNDGGGSSRVPIMYVDPMFDPILLMFPKENLKELNRRLRHYYSFHPIVRNLISLHSTFPFGDMEVRCEDKELEPYWQDLSERLNLMQMIVQMSRDYELLGESFHVGNWDDTTMEWEAFHQYPPENIEVHKVYAGSGVAYFLKPDEELRKMLNSSKEIDRAVVEMLPGDFKERVAAGKPIHLDNSRVIHYANKSAGYLTRGESPLKAALKYLLAEDKLYMLMLCFTKGQQVTMASGITKNIEDVCAGERVRTHTGAVQVVTETLQFKYSGDLYTVKAAGCDRGIECTDEHPFYVKRDSGFQWVSAKDLCVGDYLVKPAVTDVGAPTVTTEITPGQARLVGYFLAEGCYKTYHRDNKRICGLRFSFNKKEINTYVADVRTLLKTELGKDSVLQPLTTCNGVNVVSTGIDYKLADWMHKWAGRYSHLKKLPEDVFYLDKNTQRQILIGLFRGDGSWNYNRMVWTTTSKDLFDQISLLVTGQGMRFSTNTHARLGHKQAYCLSLPAHEFHTFVQELEPEYSDSKQETRKELASAVVGRVEELSASGLGLRRISRELSKDIPAQGKRWDFSTIARILRTGVYGRVSGAGKGRCTQVVDSGCSLIPITKISVTKVSNVDVYNFDVAVDNSYLIGNHLAVHNCFIDRHMFPIKIWKIGSKEQKWLPSKKHFEMLKAKLIEAKGDPDYDLIYHAFLEMEYKTGSTQHEDLIKWFDWTQKRILIAMFANEAMFAEANPYAKEAMSIKLIMHRYMLQRALVNRQVSDKVWMPVAKKREYIIRNQSEAAGNISNAKTYIPDIKKYAVPKLFWRPSNLVSGMQEQEYLAKMRKEGDLPAEVIYDILGFDTNKMRAALESEQATPLDPVWREGRKDAMKDPTVRNETLRGHKLRDIELPRTVTDPKAGPGRPGMPPGDKAIPPGSGAAVGMTPNAIVPPRDKMADKGKLPSPMGEGAPTLPEM